MRLRVILIGGTSHAGKSTLAAHLAERLGWSARSTDYLARHPGRPWRVAPDVVPAHVAEHYGTLPVDELIDDVLRHYARLWPAIEAIIAEHAVDGGAERLVLEGSALWPDTVATLRLERVAGVWLTAGSNFLAERIYRESDFTNASAEGQLLISKFVARTQRYNELMIEAIKRHKLPSVNVETVSSLDELADLCLERMKQMLNAEC